MDKADKSARITAVVDTIRRKEFIDYSKTADHFKYNCTLIFKRIRRKSHSRKKTDFFWRQTLTDTQKDILIKHINRLSKQKIHPISQIVKNLTKKIKKKPIRKN